ncbi:MAG: hypothetical protein KBD63_06410 [Bacteriovoracaceae bacterium]|nr:hypothetical protein [Bacteriovoracaceae bacterium]
MQIISAERFHQIITAFKNLEPILVIGDVGVDKYTYGEVTRISPEAPVPVLEVSKQWFKLGLAANVCENLKILGANPTICGVIGDDQNGSLLEELLEEKDLKTWGILRAEERSTIVKERVMTQTQQICRVDYDSFQGLSSQSLKKIEVRIQEFAKNHGAVIVEDYGKGYLNEKLCQNIFSLFKDQKKKVVVDPSRETPPLWYKGANLLKPNRQEAQMMVDALGYRKEKDLKKMGEILLEKLDLEQLIITLGAEGMALWDKNSAVDMQVIPTLARHVFDVSGAGDTAVSTLTASLMTGATLGESAWVANCASGVVVGKKGTATVTPDELKDFYQELISEWNPSRE